jgi:hypothetical protein
VIARVQYVCAAGGRSHTAFLVGQWHGNDGRYLAREIAACLGLRACSLCAGGVLALSSLSLTQLVWEAAWGSQPFLLSATAAVIMLVECSG